MFFTYLLLCSDGTFYAGSTNDLDKRLHAHNHLKSGAHYTKIRRPVKLVWSQNCRTYSTARKREAEIKKLTRKKKLVLITKRPPETKGPNKTRGKTRGNSHSALVRFLHRGLTDRLHRRQADARAIPDSTVLPSSRN